jgi:UDP-N-acetylglucosamine--N-acetylmuramyl-(pentapeptide) pyrophosphoryl-undecaprenol N-acetylglucosamine transferase
MAGGTGGHIFPGLALAKYLADRNWTVQWLGSVGGMEQQLVTQHGFDIELLKIKGLRGNGLVGWLKAPYRLLNSVMQARKIIRSFAPQVVIGFGGFASGPGGFASFLLGKALFIHEQNAVAGLTNKLLSRLATNCFQAFPNTLNSRLASETIGNPIRKAIRELPPKDAIDGSKIVNILVIGGSRGAQCLNQSLPSLFAEIASIKNIKVMHQCGKGNQEMTLKEYKESGLTDDNIVTVSEFIDDMASAYKNCDLVICRAGALTVSEIAAVGVAAIFVPYPFAVDDHQTLNANWLVNEEAAIIMRQENLSNVRDREAVVKLVCDAERLSTMAKNSRKSAYLNATEILGKACERLFQEAA